MGEGRHTLRVLTGRRGHVGKRRGEHRHEPLAHDAAKVRPRGKLLAEVAAFLERHAVQQLDVPLERQGLSGGVRVPPIGHTEKRKLHRVQLGH
eukprot:2002435-Prymnesium_polylepis.1